MQRVTTATLTAAIVLFATACAVRLGGPKPEQYNAIGLRVAQNESATDVANKIRSAEGDLILLSAPRDSAWLSDVATQSGLKLTRPGHTGPSTLALLTKLESLGDTALQRAVPGGGTLHMKDALYKVDNDRTIDLMLVSFTDVVSVREGVRTLLNYVATDVNGTSGVVLGIDAPTQAASDSISALVHAAFVNALECGDATTQAPAGGIGINLYFGPEARLSCTASKIVAGSPNAIVARVEVSR
jgi:hypothetical protein